MPKYILIAGVNGAGFNCFAVYKSDGDMVIYPDVPAWFQMVIE